MIARQVGRGVVFLLGLFIMSFGVAISIRATLGTSPVSSLPTVLSFVAPLSVGVFTMISNVLYLLLQIILMGRKFPPIQLLQLPALMAFGPFIDLNMAWTGWIAPTNYLMQWVWILVSIVVVAIGVYIEVLPRLTYIPGDGLIVVITKKTGWKFSRVKMAFDWTQVLLAAAISLVFLGGLYGVREGTVAAALGVGLVIQVIRNVHQRMRVDREYGD